MEMTEACIIMYGRVVHPRLFQIIAVFILPFLLDFLMSFDACPGLDPSWS